MPENITVYIPHEIVLTIVINNRFKTE